MDKHDDKWVDMMREKLENYSPPYNAAHWAGLAGKLPAAGTGGHGWLLSKLLPHAKILFISSIVVITTVVSLVYYANVAKTESSPLVDQQKGVVENVFHQDRLTEETGVAEVEYEGKETGLNVSEVKTKEPGVFEGEKEMTATEADGTVKNEGSDNAFDDGKDIEDRKETQEEGTLISGEELVSSNAESCEQSTANGQVAAGNETAVSEPAFSESNSNDLYPMSEEDDASILSAKLRPEGIESYEPVRAHNIVVKKQKQDRSKEAKTKQKKLKYEKPFYLGVSYAGAVVNDELWYPHKFQNLFGVSFEKYVFRGFSVSFNPEVSFNSICKKYEGGTLPVDSLSFTAVDDSTWLPVPPDSSEVYPGKLSYVNMPVVFSYDFLAREKYKLSASVGVISRYTFSVQKADLSKELKDMNNKFSFLSSGRFSLRYNRILTDKMFFEVEPYWEFPLKNDQEFFNTSFYGFNLYLKFRMH